MLTAYTFSSDGFIKECLFSESPDWIDLADPDEAELRLVRERHKLPDWFLYDSLDPREHPRIDQEGDKVLSVIRLPIQSGRPEKVRFTTAPVGLVLARDIVVSVSRCPGLVSDHLRGLFNRKRNWNCVRLAFAIFQAAGTGFIEKLELMEEEANRSEERLRLSTRNEEILNILGIEKSLIHITTALKSNHALMEKFTRPDSFGLALTREERDLLDDAMTENQQAIFMADIFSQVLASLSDAFSGIISNNLNKIMKFLAGVTIVLTIPMIVAGYYGMNVALPASSSPWAFWGACAFALGLMIAVSVLFAKKNWF